MDMYIGSTPALIIGDKSDKVFLFVHGLNGHTVTSSVATNAKSPSCQVVSTGSILLNNLRF